MSYNPTRTPAEDFALRLGPNYQEYLTNPCSDRLAENVVSSVVRFYEWAYEYLRHNDRRSLAGATSLEAFRKNLFAACPDLGVIHDLDNGFKHRELRQAPRSTIALSSTSAFLPDQGGFIIQPDGQQFEDVLARGIGHLKHAFGL